MWTVLSQLDSELLWQTFELKIYKIFSIPFLCYIRRITLHQQAKHIYYMEGKIFPLLSYVRRKKSVAVRDQYKVNIFYFIVALRL